MSSSRVEAELRKRVTQQAVVADLSRRVLDTDDPDELLNAVSDAVRTALDADACLFFERLPRGDRAARRHASGWEGERAPATVTTDPDESLVGYALRRGEPVAVDDLRTDDRFDAPTRLLKGGARSSLCVPVGPSDEPRATLEAHATEPDAFDGADVAILRTIGNVLAAAFEIDGSDRRIEEEWTVKEQFLERSPVGITVVDAGGEMRFANERAAELLRRSESELLGERLWDVFPEAADRTEVRDSFHAAMETQEPTSYEVYFEPLEFWVEANFYPSESGVSIHFRDVTARKEREQELEQYQALTEAAQDVVVTVDEESTLRAVNPAVEDVFGYDRDELVGESLTTLMPDRFEDGHYRGLERYLETGERTLDWEYVELPGLCEDGSEIPLAISFSEVEYEGECFFTGILRDVTERRERERQLREKRDLTDRIVETSPTGIVTLGVDGSFERVNERAEEILRYSASELEELVGGTAELDPIGPDGESFSAEEVPTRRVFDDGETIHDLEIGVLRGDGERVWLSLSGTPLRDDGEIGGAVFTFADITERKRMEADLRASEEKFRQVAENVEQVIWMSTPHKNETLYVNPAYEDVWGLSCESLYGDPESFLDGVHPDDRERVREALSDQLEGEYDEEYRVVRPDGEVRWVRDRAVPIRDEDGDVYRVVGIASDVTDQRAVERELRERERELSTLMSNVPGMVYRCRNERGWPMEFVSDGCEELTGYNPTALERDEVQWGTDVVAERDQGSLWEHIQTNINDREPFSATYRIETAAGDSRWVKETGRAVFEDGAIEAIEGVVIDITERKEYQQKLEETNERLVRANERLERSNERLERSNERLEHFAYATSHDLQEPLRMVSSYLRLIESRYGDELDEDGEEFLEFAVDGADRMREMIDGLLAYSRVETRGQPLEPVALNDVVDDVRTDLRLQLEESDATLAVADLPRVEGDPGQLRQVFRNLFDNALEYSGDEPPTIDVSAERAGETWVVSVSDRGIGIPDENAGVIFEVFERLHTVDEYEGTGIGLALCQRIVERHDGEIWVDSEPGEGATFSFTLPAVEDDRP
ncbi:PAS domain S-box protein [Natronococcus wangiae]|uniref:PAS domain S-box protein n=1 Tax=Natronococcus wangiae TaxID=3068275 RepID=UPI00273DFEF3|nr:PAS domain S-box protein [Natronococcus sp. AD5]